MSMDIFYRLREILVEKAGKERSEIQFDTKLEDLGIDSFDFIEFVFFVEDAFGIHLDINYNDVGGRLQTMGDVAKAVEGYVNAKASSQSVADHSQCAKSA